MPEEIPPDREDLPKETERKACQTCGSMVDATLIECPECGADPDETVSLPPTPPPPPSDSTPKPKARTFKCKHCGQEEDVAWKLANHTKSVHPKPKAEKPRKLEARRDDPTEAVLADVKEDVGVTADERARLLGEVRSMIKQMTRLPEELRDEFSSEGERLRILSAELGSSKKLTRSKFEEIDGAVRTEIKVQLEDLVDLSKESKYRDRRKGDGIDSFDPFDPEFALKELRTLAIRAKKKEYEK